MHTDPIADLLTRIRNGMRSGAKTVQAPMSKIKLEIVKLLHSEAFIDGYEVITAEKFPVVKINLKYNDKRGKMPAIQHIKRISKPGLRIYKQAEDLTPILHGLGIAIVSTSKGIMTDRSARKQRVGGEVICEVW